MAEDNTSQQEDFDMNSENHSATEEAAESIQTVTEEDIEILKNDLKTWQDKANEYLDGWQRARADFTNYKRRIERDQAQASLNARANAIRRFLEVVDDLELALKNRPAEGEGAAWADGVELIYRKLSAILDAEGVSQIEATGEFFDPTLHEAITNEPHPEVESGRIIAVVKQGYRLGDRVLRPAQVRVAQ
jgi:molecular chaperone GrpE